MFWVWYVVNSDWFVLVSASDVYVRLADILPPGSRGRDRLQTAHVGTTVQNTKGECCAPPQLQGFYFILFFLFFFISVSREFQCEPRGHSRAHAQNAGDKDKLGKKLGKADNIGLKTSNIQHLFSDLSKTLFVGSKRIKFIKGIFPRAFGRFGNFLITNRLNSSRLLCVSSFFLLAQSEKN